MQALQCLSCCAEAAYESSARPNRKALVDPTMFWRVAESPLQLWIVGIDFEFLGLDGFTMVYRFYMLFTCFYHVSLLKVELYRLEDVYDVREVNGTRCRCCGPSSATCRIRVRRCEDRPSSLLWPSSRKPRRMRSTGGAV